MSNHPTRFRSALLLGAACALALSFAAPAQAQSLTNLIVNPSFEDPAVTGDAAAFTITGWGQGQDTGVTNDGPNGGPGTPPPASDGKQFAFLGNGNNFTNLYQDFNTTGSIVGDATVTSYTLTIGFAVRAGFGEFPGTNATLDLGIQDLAAGGATIRTSVPRASLSTTAFTDFSVVLPATGVNAGDTFRIFVDKLDGNSLTLIDNVRLVANVPEPGTVALLVLGAVGGAVCLRRRLA